VLLFWRKSTCVHPKMFLQVNKETLFTFKKLNGIWLNGGGNSDGSFSFSLGKYPRYPQSVKCIPLHSSDMTSPALFVYRGLSHGHSSHTRLPSKNERKANKPKQQKTAWRQKIPSAPCLWAMLMYLTLFYFMSRIAGLK